MHYTKVKGILSSENGMNLYRGCTHGCIYCDSRSRCYQINHVFEDVEVKENALELLEQALRRKRKKCMIATGAMTDPYLHLEEKLNYTRRALELIADYGFGLSIQTKSDRILRDLDLLKKINERGKRVVQITMTTWDEKLCRKIEPHVSSTRERYRVLKILEENGIPAIVWISPILPFINDTEENVNGILDYCIDAKVYGVLCFSMGLTLREGNREYFYAQLREKFPGLEKKYQSIYGNRYEVISPKNTRLMELLRRRCQENELEYRVKELFAYMRKFPCEETAVQLELSDFLEGFL